MIRVKRKQKWIAILLTLTMVLTCLLGTFGGEVNRILTLPGKAAAMKNSEVVVKKVDGGWYSVSKKTGKKVNYTGVAKNEYGWWRVVNGKVDFNATGIYENDLGWWRCVGGKVDFNATGIYQNDYGWWRCVGGKVNFKADGVYKNEYGWWAVEGGKVRFNYTGIKSNAYGVWFAENGRVRFNYTGIYDGNYIENSRVVGRVEKGEPSARVQEVFAGMTLDEKIAQMFVVRPEALTGTDTATSAGSSAKSTLQKYPVGGVILFARNLKSGSQTKGMISNLQSYSKSAVGAGLFMAVDEEGGRVARCASKLGTTKFSPMLTYEGKGSGTAYSNANRIAKDIKQFGFNVNFAPVADIAPKNNSATEQRIYSRNYTIGSNLIYSAVCGYKDGGVSATLKHFPGLGSTTKDPHDTWTTINKSPERMRTEDYIPFAAGIAAGADFVMVGHVVNNAVDGNIPASLSYYYTTQVLRDELGFDGLIVTDSLEMGAITKYFGQGESAVMAVQAGSDLLLMPGKLSTAFSAVKKAVQNGSISRQRIDESVLRILMQKEKMGLL